MFINIFGHTKSKHCSAILRLRRAGPCLHPLLFAFELIRFLLHASVPFLTSRSSKWGVHGNVYRVTIAVIKHSCDGGGYEHASRQGGEAIPTTDETSFLYHSIEQGVTC